MNRQNKKLEAWNTCLYGETSYQKCKFALCVHLKTEMLASRVASKATIDLCLNWLRRIGVLDAPTGNIENDAKCGFEKLHSWPHMLTVAILRSLNAFS